MLATGPEISLKSARAATQTLPMVMLAIEYDPIARGYVTSLARPTSNITGMFLQQIELAEKRVQILKGCVPKLTGRNRILGWDISRPMERGANRCDYAWVPTCGDRGARPPL
jgi:putative tryptophan/tyrosine transport system substrate-binding protein